MSLIQNLSKTVTNMASNVYHRNGVVIPADFISKEYAIIHDMLQGTILARQQMVYRLPVSCDCSLISAHYRNNCLVTMVSG